MRNPQNHAASGSDTWNLFLRLAGFQREGGVAPDQGDISMRQAIAGVCAPYGFGWKEIAKQLKTKTVPQAGAYVDGDRNTIETLAKAVHAILKETGQLDGEMARPPADPARAEVMRQHGRNTWMQDFAPNLEFGAFDLERDLAALSANRGPASTRQEAAPVKARVEGPRPPAKYELGTKKPTSFHPDDLVPPQIATLSDNEKADALWKAGQATAKELNARDVRHSDAVRRGHATRRAKKAPADSKTDSNVLPDTAVSFQEAGEPPGAVCAVDADEAPFTRWIQTQLTTSTPDALAEKWGNRFNAEQIVAWSQGKTPTYDQTNILTREIKSRAEQTQVRRTAAFQRNVKPKAQDR